LADFSRILLEEIGYYHPGYQIVRNLSIKQRYKLLYTLVPDLLTFDNFFMDIDEIRNKVEHDLFIPDANKVLTLLYDAKQLKTIFDDKILPSLTNIDRTSREKLQNEWQVIVNLVDILYRYPQQFISNSQYIDSQIKEFQTIISRIDELSSEAVNEARINLRDLQRTIEASIVDSKDVMEWESAQEHLDQLRGK